MCQLRLGKRKEEEGGANAQKTKNKIKNKVPKAWKEREGGPNAQRTHVKRLVMQILESFKFSNLTHMRGNYGEIFHDLI